MLNRRDLEEFIGLVTQTEKKKSPELRIPIANARRVADGLAFLLVELQDQQKALAESQQKLADSQVTSIELDGGSF
jgi:hypothetical protein